MTQEERDAQVLSFAWGNLAIEEPTTTHQSMYNAFIRVHGRKPLAVPEDWEIVFCGLCGEPMPDNETMFMYHGYSGPCPI